MVGSVEAAFGGLFWSTLTGGEGDERCGGQGRAGGEAQLSRTGG